MMDAPFATLVDFFAQWASVFWSTLRESAPFLTFGLLLAGLLHVLVPSKVILWALGRGGWSGAVRGSLVGMPLPLCSCSVVPTALTLRRQGASLSASTSFMISTPETSIDALAITLALLPSAFLGIRPLAALLLAVFVGVIVELFSKNTKDKLRENVLEFARVAPGVKQQAAATECCDSECAAEPTSPADICRVCGLMTAEEHRHGPLSKLKAVMGYAFGTFFRDIATWLIVGLVAAALLQILLPPDAFHAAWLKKYPAIQILLAVIVGIPLYTCATATTPLVAVLLAKGMDPGAALAFLLAGPATNIGNVFALRREFGGRITVVYYVSLFILCWVLGLGLSLLWPTIEKIPELTQVATGGAIDWLAEGMPGWVEVLTACLLVLLTLKTWGGDWIARLRGGDTGATHDHAH